jgi:small subunit ribosomal protein S21
MHSDENDAIGGEVTPKDAPAPETAAEVHEGADRDAEARDGERRGRRKAEGFGETVQCRPLEVIVKDDRVEQAIRQLKNRLAREGVLRELKNRRHYFKPSELKRIKSREAARRRRKQARQRPRTK